MVQSNVILFGWNHAIPGREPMAAELFAHTVSFFDKQKSAGKLESWQPVFLTRHGGDLNGFFLLQGTHANLDALISSDEFIDITMRADQYLTGVGVIQGYTGNVVQDLMGRWTKTIPSR
jgi:hypothetical protein